MGTPGWTSPICLPQAGDASKSILIMSVHPSARDFLDRENPLGPTTVDPFAPEALYELKIDTDGNAVADIAYRVRFSSSEGGAQTATLRRAEGAQAAGSGDSGRLSSRGIGRPGRRSVGKSAKRTHISA